MKHTLFFIFFIFTCFYTHAQSWQIGISVKPLISYPGFDESYVFHAIRYQPISTYAYGISVREAITPKWSLETGVSFLRLGYKVNYIRNYVAGQLFAPGRSVSGAIRTMLEVPIGLQYKIGSADRKWRFSIHAGVNIAFTTSSKRISTRMANTFATDIRFPDTKDMTITTEVDNQPFTKANPYLKVSVERNVGGNQYISIGLIHNQGLSAMYDNKITYTARGENFENHIYIKGSYTGLQLTYFFSIFQKKLKHNENQ